MRGNAAHDRRWIQSLPALISDMSPSSKETASETTLGEAVATRRSWESIAGGGQVEATAEAGVCVVATRPETVEACCDGGYPCPRSYDRTDRAFAWLACYQPAPVSAITHCAPVLARTVEHRGEDGGWMTSDRWARLIDPFSATDEVVVFELGDLLALADPVENDITGVRGAWYGTLGALRDSETLSEFSGSTSEG